MNNRVGWRHVAAAAAIGVAVFALLGEATKTDTSSGGKNQAPNAGQTSSGGGGGGDAAASSKTSPVPLGTEATVAKGWKMKVNSVNLNADSVLAQSNQFNKPQPGEQFVLANVSVTNASDEPGTPAMNLKMSWLPPSGVAVSGLASCLVSAPNQLDQMAQMQPGASTSGDVCFSVKTAEIANGLILAEPSFTLDKTKDQVFFAVT